MKAEQKYQIKRQARMVASNAAKYLFRQGYKRLTGQADLRPAKRVRRGKRFRKSVRQQRSYNRSRKDRMDMKKIKCFINSRTATHTRRIRRSGTLTTAVGQQARVMLDNGGSLAQHELALANLRYFDSGTNNLVTISAVVGTYTRDICMSIARKIFLKNNYQIPVHVQVWSCYPKDATGTSVNSVYQNGVGDQANPLFNNPLSYFTDAVDVKNIWSVKCVVDRILQPGQTAVGRGNSPRFDYTIATNDAHTLEYQKKQGGHQFLIRIVGVLGHDSGGLAEVTTCAGGVDYVNDVVYKIEYDAGKDLHDISIDNTSGALFTTGGVVSQRIVDNQNYSIA